LGRYRELGAAGADGAPAGEGASEAGADEDIVDAEVVDEEDEKK
jgi:molecular chaperone DnaK